MLKEPTMQQLGELRLAAFASAWVEQQKDQKLTQLAFDERLALLVEAECTSRENKRAARALKDAKLRISQACIEDVDYSPKREIDRAVVRQLATCRWIDEHQNVIITGATGTGKTYLACAIAQQACRRRYRCAYRRAPRMFEELMLARAEGGFTRLLAKWTRIDLLLIDDWGMSPLKDRERDDLLEVLEDRHGVRSTIIAGQLPPDRWHPYIGDPTIADALCDRVLHNAHRIVLKGPSRRKETREKD